jgi:cyclic peptide transporter
MNYFSLFRSRSRIFYLILIFLGVLKSMVNVSILMLINSVLTGKAISGVGNHGCLFFIGLITLSFICTSLFQQYIVGLTNDLMFKLEIEIIQKIRKSLYESFVRLGSDKIYATIGDTRVLGRLPETLINVVNSFITVCCTLGYLFWVSVKGGLLVLGLITSLFYVYLKRDKLIKRDLNKIRDLEDNYFFFLHELIAGFKQIRISIVKNNNLYDKFIRANRDISKKLNIDTSRKYLINELTGTYSWYLVLGVVIYILPAFFKINVEQITAFITSILLLMAPVSQLVMFLPTYNMFKIAFNRIGDLEKKLQHTESVDSVEESRRVGFETIRFEKVVFEPDTTQENRFKLEVQDLEVNKGDIVFLVGDNGSGKTTFINLFIGLYKPKSGKMIMDGKEIGYDDYSKYGNNMAVVFSDQHLFSDIYENFKIGDVSDDFAYFKTLLNLDGVLKADFGVKHLDQKLSRGEQKRVALLMALLENKPILVLDEWASEQDPYNRKCFYNDWLPMIKRLGKTIIVISHDDDFFHVADKVVKFHYGKIVPFSNRVPQVI